MNILYFFWKLEKVKELREVKFITEWEEQNMPT